MPAGAVLIDDNLVGDLEAWGMLALNPARDQIAYQSRGALWASDLSGAPPERVVDLPDTQSAYLLGTDYASSRSRFNKIGVTDLPKDHYPRGEERPTIRINDLQWSASQGGWCYLEISSTGERSYDAKLSHKIRSVANNNTVETLTTACRERFDQPQRFWSFALPDNHNLIILYAGSYAHVTSRLPLFWNRVTQRPLVTSYDRIFPSPSCRRFLGVEIDTHQLVLLNADLRIERRYDVFLGKEHHLTSCAWSPNERHLLYKLKPAYPPRTAVPYRIDLETGEGLRLSESHEGDRFVLTGDRDEALRIGKFPIRHGGKSDGGDGSYVSLVEAGGRHETFLANFNRRTVRGRRSGEDKPYPMPVVSASTRQAVIALPRGPGTVGYRYWLVDAQGERRPLGMDNRDCYYSPWRVLAFVDGGNRLLANDYTRLFTVPIESISKDDVDGP
ncbi:hypothetical protein MalM25_24700 [Planctomycetes bacterium MalM25]|nr:hypothetical protein MalM25_24700 [Planctomycetes bacterium MalM25]